MVKIRLKKKNLMMVEKLTAKQDRGRVNQKILVMVFQQEIRVKREILMSREEHQQILFKVKQELIKKMDLKLRLTKQIILVKKQVLVQ